MKHLGEQHSTQRRLHSAFALLCFAFKHKLNGKRRKLRQAASSDKLKIDQLAAFSLDAQQLRSSLSPELPHQSDLVDSTRRLYCLRQLCTFVINLNPGNKQRNYMGRAVIKRSLDRLLCVHTHMSGRAEGWAQAKVFLWSRRQPFSHFLWRSYYRSQPVHKACVHWAECIFKAASNYG